MEKIATITVPPTLIDKDGTVGHVYKKFTGSAGPISWNDLLDKPFYEESSQVVILPEVTVNTNLTSGVSIGKPTELLKEGFVYIVSFNGEEYDCVATTMSGLVALGNGNIFGMEGGNTDAPFLIGAFPQSLVLYAADGEITVSIKVRTTELHCLDPKYINDMYYDAGDVHQIDIKYLPILEKVYKTVFNVTVNGELEFTNPFLSMVTGSAKFIVDGDFETTSTFKDYGTWSIAQFSIPGGAAAVETRYGEYLVSFSDSGTHTLKMMIEKDVIKEQYLPDTALVLNSSTEGSMKRFRITVDDSGMLNASEIVN